MTTFIDREVKSLDIEHDVEDFIFLVSSLLCSETVRTKISSDVIQKISKLLKKPINFSEFNELLLSVNQDKVSEQLFNFLFDNKKQVTKKEIAQGISKFRGYAMLCYGNFRQAFKRFNELSYLDLIKVTEPYSKPQEETKNDYKREKIWLDPIPIAKNETWLAGEITGQLIETEIRAIEDRIKNLQVKDEIKTAKAYNDEIIKLHDDEKRVQANAVFNTDIYLTWNDMDVYFATSMRNRWEFEEVNDFITQISSDRRIKDLKLRVFDPTQSKCDNARDKGLIEGLMLRRVKCTIYMVQQTDTMGKDSELAATLAQSTPVIAYVPSESVNQLAEKISRFPLNYFKNRIMILQAEGLFEYKECVQELQKIDEKAIDKVEIFLSKLKDFLKTFPFKYWYEMERELFIVPFGDEFNLICKLLATVEIINFERRASLLKGRHPLSMQVDLQTGVANGVLVVRNEKKYANLLHSVLMNKMKFEIIHHKLMNFKQEEVESLLKEFPKLMNYIEFDKEFKCVIQKRQPPESVIEEVVKGTSTKEKEKINQSFKNYYKQGYIILLESISRSPFRVVTDNEKLTNSFWNLFESMVY